ncbi:MAG TPA: substrate-binding domain-containing protein [Planctomycetota bacterium]
MKRVAVAIDLDWPVPHHHGIVSGVLKVAREKGWACEVDPFLGFPGAGSGPFDGVVGRVTRELAAWARRTRTPVVNVWTNSPDRALPRVLVDYAAGGRLAAEHLLDRGFRTFGFVGRENDASGRELLEGFTQALRSRGFGRDVLEVPADPPDVQGWLRLQRPLRSWAASWKPPIGILASIDILGRYLVDIALRAKLRIPDDAAIVGAGNQSLMCDLLEPTLSSVEYGFERVGRRAAELLERLMKGGRAEAAPLRVPPSGVVARRSTDVFAVEDPSVAAALRLIWAKSDRPLKVAAILGELPSSRRTLERRFRDTLGRTIHDEIRRAHIERAKRLLVETREPLKVVASKAGFRDAQQFSRVFRGVERRTPQQYRLTHR